MLDAMSKGEYNEARLSTPVRWRITMLTGPKKLWKTLKKTRAQQWNSEVHRLPKCYHWVCDLSFLCNVFRTLRKPGRLTSGKLASHLRELVRKSDGVSNAPFDD